MPRADVVMKMPQAYTGSLSNPNDYRCFVLDPHLTKPTYMTGYDGDARTRSPRSTTRRSSTSTRRQAAGRRADERPGRQARLVVLRRARRCPTAARFKAFQSRHAQDQLTKGFVGGFTGQPGLVAGWVPGQDPVIYPEDSGILIEPGDALVLQIHYHYDTTPDPRPHARCRSSSTPGTEKVKPHRHHQPDRAGRDPVHARRRRRRCATATRRSPTTPGSTARLGALHRARSAAACAARRPSSWPPTFKDGVAHTTCDYQVPVRRHHRRRCSATCTRWARASG